MTREQLIEYLDTVLSQAAHGPPPGPRPAGTFLCSPVATELSGLRLVSPGDGAVFYLAVIDPADLRDEEEA